jgi:hypothetical protein
VAVLGLHLQKGFLRYAVLDGPSSGPALVAKDRLVTPDPSRVPALMDWYDTKFRQLLDDFRPHRISYRLTLDPKKDQLFYLEFPLGVLNLIAHQQAISVSCYTARAFAPSRLGMSRDTDLYALCDAVFGQNPPYWDDNQKHAILAAWFEL